MRFGMFTSMGNQTWPAVLEMWKHAEATRWDVACVTDHFMPNNLRLNTRPRAIHEPPRGRSAGWRRGWLPAT